MIFDWISYSGIYLLYSREILQATGKPGVAFLVPDVLGIDP